MTHHEKEHYSKTEYISSELDLARIVYVARHAAQDFGFSKFDTSVIVTSIQELGQNILKYAGRGYITISTVKDSGKLGMEIIVHDRGPGIGDLDAAMHDDYSTGGTLGIGLPGVKRMMDEFFIDSAPDQGTKIVIRKWL